MKMNVDNQRLEEIQRLKNGYNKLIGLSETMFDMFKYQSKIDELENEELEILARFDVKI